MCFRTIRLFSLAPLWAMFLVLVTTQASAQEVLLNGIWQRALQDAHPLAQQYDTTVTVPGFQTSTTTITKTSCWLRRTITVTDTRPASLTLNGARFAPTIYLNGKLVAQAAGGMAPITVLISKDQWLPNAENVLEVKLTGLGALDPKDASFVPYADHWRSNVGACIWDDVVLRWHHADASASITRVVPAVDSSLRNFTLGLRLTAFDSAARFTGNLHYKVQVRDATGKVVVQQQAIASTAYSLQKLAMKLPANIKHWSPQFPYRYNVMVQLTSPTGQVLDQQQFAYGFKYAGLRSTSKQRHFVLNDKPLRLRMISIVWHRWVRNKEGQELAYDSGWFKKNILQRSQNIGANAIRFHLGTPPERYLDWCDSMGFAVQLEWLFFHGLKASEPSMKQQWQHWLDLAARHPSVVLIHPWNETEGDELQRGWSALNHVLPDYGRLLIAERDQWHIHKYWWSLFENLGLYYDHATQFPTPIVADEFGGNYLDGEGNLGGYKTLVESYQRFLGPYHTKSQRLHHHTLANAKVAEYWRRADAAGYSPFCALSSYEDGNHWFLGPLKEGKPKPVWQALAPAYSPVAVSLDLWNRHFSPATKVSLPVHVFNERNFPHQAIWQLHVVDAKGKMKRFINHSHLLPPHSHTVRMVDLTLPGAPGTYTVTAWLKNPPKGITVPVKSSWTIRVIKPAIGPEVAKLKVFIPEGETELLAFAQEHKLTLTTAADAQVTLLGHRSWQALQRDPQQAANWQRIPKQLWLQVGPQSLGKSYPTRPMMPADSLGPWQASATVKNPADSSYTVLPGLRLKFRELPEAESHLHADSTTAIGKLSLRGLLSQDLHLMNGLRGGLAIPAWDMQVEGMQAAALRTDWQNRGANLQMMDTAASYWAYELGGYYAFSPMANDKATQDQLRARVRFLREDAPALRNVLNPDGPIVSTDLKRLLSTASAQEGSIATMQTVLRAGKSLARTPAVLLDLSNGQRHLYTQLIVNDRLATPFTTKRYASFADPAVQQLVLNWLEVVGR